MKIEKRHTDWIEISHGLYSLEIFTGPQWLFGNWFKDWTFWCFNIPFTNIAIKFTKDPF